MQSLPELLTVAVLLTSLAVWGMILERLYTGEPLIPCRVPVTRPRPPVAMTIVGLWILISLFMTVSAELQGQEKKLRDINLPEAIEIAAGNILEQCVVVSIMVISLTGLGVRSLNRYGIDGRKIGEKLSWGVVGYVASTIPVILVIILMQRFHSPENKHPFLQLLDQQQSPLLVALLGISTIVMAPLSEELMYRVILQGSLQRYLPPWAAIMGASVVFSVVHGFPDAVSLLPLALTLGFLYWRTGSYLVVVTTHAAFNGFNILMALLGAGEPG